MGSLNHYRNSWYQIPIKLLVHSKKLWIPRMFRCLIRIHIIIIILLNQVLEKLNRMLLWEMKFQMKATKKILKLLRMKSMKQIKVLNWFKCNKTMKSKTKINIITQLKTFKFNNHKTKIELKNKRRSHLPNKKKYVIKKLTLQTKLFYKRWFQ